LRIISKLACICSFQRQDFNELLMIVFFSIKELFYIFVLLKTE